MATAHGLAELDTTVHASTGLDDNILMMAIGCGRQRQRVGYTLFPVSLGFRLWIGKISTGIPVLGCSRKALFMNGILGCCSQINYFQSCFKKSSVCVNDGKTNHSHITS